MRARLRPGNSGCFSSSVLLGGFTTFSAFGYETLALVRTAELFRATVNVGLHLVLGLAAVWVGYTVGNQS